MTPRHVWHDYDEVKKIGSSLAHPNQHTDAALFWTVNFVTQLNEALRGIAEARVRRLGDRVARWTFMKFPASD